MPNLESLPVEILLAIANELEDTRDINSLVRASRYLCNNLTASLYQTDAWLHDMSALRWASNKVSIQTASRSINNSSLCKTRRKNLGKALAKAARNGHTTLVSLILTQREVNLNIIDNGSSDEDDSSDKNERMTPLQLAASAGHVDVVKALLEDDRMNLEFLVPLFPPIYNGAQEASSECRLIATSCLFLAARNGHAAVVDILLDVPGIRPNAHDRFDRTPLINAVVSESLETVRSFINRPSLEIDFNIQGSAVPLCDVWRKQRNPLLLASALKSPHIANLLLSVPGINVDHYNKRNETALYFAASQGTSEIVRSLLEHGAHPDPRDLEGETPLWHAAKRGDVAMVKMLLEAGADPNHTCKRGCHPLGAAETFGHTEVKQALLESARIDLGSLKPVPERWHKGRRMYRTLGPNRPKSPFHT
jgi:ankyrin repeat protein